MFGSLGGAESALVAAMLIGSLVVVALPVSRICVRIGYPAWLGILAVLPLLNVALLWFVAFAEWPEASRPVSPVEPEAQ